VLDLGNAMDWELQLVTTLAMAPAKVLDRDLTWALE